jgi:hypothetical protein
MVSILERRLCVDPLNRRRASQIFVSFEIKAPAAHGQPALSY